MMKGSSTAGLLVSVLTASTVALSSISSDEHHAVSDRSYIQRSHWSSSSTEENEHGSFRKEKFPPRFDGMRFIETLITAHR